MLPPNLFYQLFISKFMLSSLVSLSHAKLKLTILILLTLNALIYAVLDSVIAAVDAFAWLAFLLSFECETLNLPFTIKEDWLHKIRNGLIALIVLVSIGYLFIGDLLNLLNSVFWIGLIVLLEVEIRAPNWISSNPTQFWIASISVISGLLGMVLIWGWLGNWLDAYNGALWISAFALIEVDLFRFLRIRR